jgi:hypothetical protein
LFFLKYRNDDSPIFIRNPYFLQVFQGVERRVLGAKSSGKEDKNAAALSVPAVENATVNLDHDEDNDSEENNVDSDDNSNVSSVKSSKGKVKPAIAAKTKVSKGGLSKLGNNTTGNLKSMPVLPNNTKFNWEDVLSIIQASVKHSNSGSSSSSSSSGSGIVHPNLPELRITPSVLQRTQLRLQGLFGSATVPAATRTVPTVFNYSGDKR